MPGTLFAADSSFPDLDGFATTEQKLDAVRDYLYLLLESLRWTLRNLSPANFNEQELSAYLDEKLDEAEAVVTETVITDELYAAYGAVADLTVDELRTDCAKAARYLAGNTAALDWLYIHDEEIDFLSGTVALDENRRPLTEQLHHRGRYFWWTDAGKTRMTSLEDTGLPVTVYRYDELLKAAVRFETANGVKIPTFVFGAGVGDPLDPNKGKGFIRKNTASFDIWLHGPADNGLFIGEYTDIAGLRKTTEIDFSNWDSGSFTETVDGDVTHSFTVDFDAADRPVKITDAAGHETEVIWE